MGRDEQLRLVKDLLHAAWRDRRLRFVSIIGQPGTGKSRLVWELYKYIDGLVEDVYWHQGRSPAYGEGITFWALGEMVRKRAGLAEGDDAATTRQRIGEMLSELVPDEGERRWMEPKLLGLLGQGELGWLEREELFAAWRTLFERVSRKGVTVLIFEDTHWADQGVLDFIDHMAEWSTDHPILLVTLARPELQDRRPDWGVGRRGFTALTLDPLPEARMEELLAGLVTGLPGAARQAILQRADGVPLYAVEMVRKLLLDGRLEREGDTLRPLGDLTRLEVPATLHSLIAARLDALGSSDRSLLGVASVLGQSFSPAALAAVSGGSGDDLAGRLRDLVRRDILAQNRDPRSPERGQFAFVQALIREVAYGTLSRRDRRARHLAAARYFESLGDEELAGVLATHYLDAYRASEPGAEADAIAAQARIALRAAAERATALHSPDQALAYLVPALEVTRDEAERAALLELAGEAARRAARAEEATGFLVQAEAAYRACGDRPGAIRVTTALGLLHTAQGRPDDAIAVLTPTLEGAADLGESREVLALCAALARAHLFADDHAMALMLIDEALVSAGRTDDVAIVTDAIVTKGTLLLYMQRYWEGVAMMAGGLDLAQSHGFVLTELRARLNMSFSQATDDPRLALETARTGLERARRLGLRDWSLLLAGNAADPLFAQGEWDAVIGLATDLAVHADTASVAVSDLPGVALAIRALRGEEESLEEDLRGFDQSLSGATPTQERSISQLVHLWVDLARGRLTHVVDRDLGSLDPGNGLNCHKVVGHAALWTGDMAGARRAAEGLEDCGVTRRWSSAVALGLQSGIAALEGHDRDAEDGYREAAAAMADLGAVRDLALLHLDRVATAADPGAAREAADSARPLLSRMGAAALEDRLERLLEGRAGLRSAVEAMGPGRPRSRGGLADRSEISAPA